MRDFSVSSWSSSCQKLWTVLNIAVQGDVKYLPNITVAAGWTTANIIFHSIVFPSCIGGMQCVWVEVVTQALAQKSGGKIPPPTSYVIGFHLSNNIVPFVKGMTSYLFICHQFQFPFRNSPAGVQTPSQPLHVFWQWEWKWNTKDDQRIRWKSFSHLCGYTHLLSSNYLHLLTLPLEGLVTFGENSENREETRMRTLISNQQRQINSSLQNAKCFFFVVKFWIIF